MAGDLANQTINMVFRDKDFNCGRLRRRAPVARPSAAGLELQALTRWGIPIQDMIIQPTAKGVSGGMVSGATQSLVTF
jgi:hypothetical protein